MRMMRGVLAWKLHRPKTYLRMVKRRIRLGQMEHSTFNGLTFYHTVDTLPYPESFVKDVAPREMFDLVIGKKGEVAVDAGACIGFYSLQFAKRFLRVWGFEPHPSNFALFQRNIRKNMMVNVIAEQVALSNRDGLAELHVKDHYKASSSLIPRHLGQNLDKTIPVNTRSLDSYRLRNVDLLKIDVEGFEIPVLKGASETIETYHPCLAVEVHASPTGNPCTCACCELIEDYGYQIKESRVHRLVSADGSFAKDFTTDTSIHWVIAE